MLTDISNDLLSNSVLDKTVESYNSLYNSKRTVDFYNESIKPNQTSVFNDPMSCMGALTILKEIPELTDNAIHFRMVKSLSENNRITIPRIADIFLGIRIPCLSLSDIQEATLFSSGILNENNDPQKYFDPQAEIIYTPIKTITKFESNFVTFYDCPIFIASELYNGLSIEIKFKEENNIHSHFVKMGVEFQVELSFLFVGNDTRREMMANYSRYMK